MRNLPLHYNHIFKNSLLEKNRVAFLFAAPGLGFRGRFRSRSLAPPLSSRIRLFRLEKSLSLVPMSEFFLNITCGTYVVQILFFVQHNQRTKLEQVQYQLPVLARLHRSRIHASCWIRIQHLAGTFEKKIIIFLLRHFLNFS
jgi:hypothetical protein